MTKEFKVLIGYDGSEYAGAAIDDLVRAGLPGSVRAFVATVSEMWLRMPLSYGRGETNSVDETAGGLQQAREIAAEGADKIRSRFPHWELESAAAAGSPSEILLTMADEWKPDLFVVGSQSRGPIGSFILGSVAQSLVQNSFCPVRIARMTVDSRSIEGDPSRLIVGVDGSRGSECAVESIVSREWSAGTEVHVVSAMDYIVPLRQFDLSEPSGRTHSTYYYEEYRKAEKNVDQAIDELKRVGFRPTSVIKHQKDPIHLLIEEAKEWNADCIFVGAKGKSRIERLLLGSVSSAVAARADCSVEVVRQPDN